MKTLPDEILEYLADPRFEQVMALAEKHRPQALLLPAATSAQEASNFVFCDKGWQLHLHVLRSLGKTKQEAKQELEATYNTDGRR